MRRLLATLVAFGESGLGLTLWRRPRQCRSLGTRALLGPRRPSRAHARHHVALGTAAVLAVVSSVLAPSPAAAQETVLRPPTSAAVLDGFRAPEGPYGPGNRGIEYDTAPGDLVTAAGPGQVVFAGPVAGQLYVTIDHGGGLLSSYSYLRSLTVRRGQHVTAGQRIAVAAGPMHFGTRIDGSYVDPATLFGVRKVTVALVPHHDPDLEADYLDLVERSERLQYLLGPDAPPGGLGGLLKRIGGVIRDIVTEPFVVVDIDAFRSDLAVALEAVVVLGQDANPYSGFVEFATAITEALQPRECTSADAAVPAAPQGERRIAVTVSGLGSSTETGSYIDRLDLAALGYGPDDIVAAGYRLDPDGSTDYTADDTYQPVADSAEALRRRLRQIAAEHPGVPIDVYAHSLGGVVAVTALTADHALATAAAPAASNGTTGGSDGTGGLGHSAAADGPTAAADPLVDMLVTFASPLGGTPAAELANAIGSADPLDAVVSAVPLSELLDTPVLDDLDGPVVHDGAGLPTSTEVLTLVHRGDPIVPAHLASLPGRRHVILDEGFPIGGHGSVITDPAALREIRLARAGLPPGCEGTIDRVLDAVLPRAIAKTTAVAADSVRVVDVFANWGDEAGAVGQWHR